MTHALYRDHGAVLWFEAGTPLDSHWPESGSVPSRSRTHRACVDRLKTKRKRGRTCIKVLEIQAHRVDKLRVGHLRVNIFPGGLPLSERSRGLRRREPEGITFLRQAPVHVIIHRHVVKPDRIGRVEQAGRGIEQQHDIALERE